MHEDVQYAYGSLLSGTATTASRHGAHIGPLYGQVDSTSIAQILALARSGRALGGWHDGVDGVFEQYGARRRSTDFRRGQRLGTRDHLLELTKPRDRPDWMSQTDFDQAPASLIVRELHTGGDDKLAKLFVLIAQQRVANRPGRIEPRALKRRLKPCPLLTKPRHVATDIIRKKGHAKKLK